MQNRNLRLAENPRDAQRTGYAGGISTRQPFLEIRDVSKVYPTKKAPSPYLMALTSTSNKVSLFV